MRTYFTKSLFVVFLLLLSGCSIPKNENRMALVEPYMISFDLENLSDKGAPMMSDVIDSLEYIKLKTKPGLDIGFIIDYQRPYITNDYIFINCSHGAGLLQFKRNGEFVRKIGTNGRGPGEYIAAQSIIFDEKSGIIYIFPNFRRVILKHDYNSGKFLKEIPIIDLDGKQTKGSMTKASLLSDNMAFVELWLENCLGFPEYEVFCIIDLNSGHITHKEISKIYGINNTGIKLPLFGRTNANRFFYNIEGKVWYDNTGRLNYWEPLNDTSYVVNPDYTMNPRFITNYSNFKLDVKTGATLNDFKDLDNKVQLKSFHETSGYLFFEHTFKNRYFTSTFDKISGDQHLVKSISKEEYKTDKLFFGLYNDIDGGFSKLGHYDKAMWFSSYSAIDMIDRLTSQHFEKASSKVKYPDRLNKLKKFVSCLNENDNPVFVIAHLKKNK